MIIFRTIIVMTICSQYLRNIEVKLPTIKEGKITFSKIQVNLDF